MIPLAWRPRSLVAAGLASTLMGLLVVLAVASPAAAHTGFASSTPADGDEVDEPIAEIVLEFTGPAEPTGDGFLVLDPTGVVRAPDSIRSENNNTTWVLGFDPPLAGGEVGVRWQVAAPDAHPIEGSFSFTVNARTPSVTSAAPGGSEPATTEPATTGRPTSATPSTIGDSPAAQHDSVETTTRFPSTSTGPSSATSNDESPVPAEIVELDEFLRVGGGTSVDALTSLSRALTMVGLVGVVGGLIFASAVARDDSVDVALVLAWTTFASILLVIGANSEAVTTVANASGDGRGFTDVLFSSFGVAVGLRAAGALLVVVGLAAHRRTVPAARWRIDRVPLAAVGAIAITISFLFDGHTVSEGPIWLHGIVNVVHVLAISAWAGGVVMLIVVTHDRRQRGAAPRTGELAARFSVVATGAIVAAGLAGTALTLIILDTPSGLWSTSWGRVLIAKVALVAVAAVGGAYNHRVMVPALSRDEDSVGRFGRILAIEAGALTGVIVATAVLVSLGAR